MVIWKGRNLKDLGIIVESTPKISKAKKKINVFEIPGRNGFLSEDEGVYEDFSISIDCHIKENVNIDEICEFLDGYGTLSFDNRKQYTAIINNSIPFEKVLMFKKFIIQFLVNPICEEIEARKLLVQSSPCTLEINDTYYYIEPVIKLTCSGDISITINENTFYLEGTNGSYTLDCKNKLISINGLNAANIMIGDFPRLLKGNNLISYIGSITNFEIEYRKTYLWGG